MESSVTESETDEPSDISEAERSASDSDGNGQGEEAPLLAQKPVVARKQRPDEVR